MFQFYDSPIKRFRAKKYGNNGNKFQFYDSPIKSSDMEKYKTAFVGFNSMIVRLKVYIGLFIFMQSKFQFYDSPIKSIELPDGRFMMNRKFQFYDSPIKSYGRFGPFRIYCCFNSMIVRLKGKTHSLSCPPLQRFQFYDSPIKRLPKSYGRR